MGAERRLPPAVSGASNPDCCGRELLLTSVVATLGSLPNHRQAPDPRTLPAAERNRSFG
jgi:hypothetical protein